MPTKVRWIVPGPALALLTVLVAVPHAGHAKTPVPPAAPVPQVAPAPPAPRHAPPAPTVPAPPHVPLPALAPDDLVDIGAADPADPAEIEEWFGDLDEETLSSAGPPRRPEDAPLAFGWEMEAPAASDEALMMHGGGMGPGGPGPWRFVHRMGMMGAHHEEMLAALKLTDAQKQRMEALRDEQRRRTIRSRADLQIAALDLRRMVHEDKADRELEQMPDVIPERIAN